MAESLKKRLDAAKEQVKEPKIKGHAIDGLERFMEDTRHAKIINGSIHYDMQEKVFE